MNDISIFSGKAVRPTDKDLVEKLGSNYELWKRIYDLVLDKYPTGLADKILEHVGDRTLSIAVIHDPLSKVFPRTLFQV
jgi:hypothetical protein